MLFSARGAFSLMGSNEIRGTQRRSGAATETNLFSTVKESTMKLHRTLTSALLLGVLSAGAIAQPQVTREQVKAELREAIRSGDIIDGYESLSRYERNPSAYLARTAVAGKTRDDVKAELAEAIRTGEMAAGGESSLKLNEQYPGHYPKAKAVARAGAAPTHAAGQSPGDSRLR
jgi:ribosomal protein L30E